MNLQNGGKLFLVAALLIVLGGVMFAQGEPEARYGLSMVDVNGEATKLWFGVHNAGTYCRDAALGESELPPVPPTGVLDARFIDHRSGSGACLGEGQIVHLQAEGTTIVDTFQLKFQPSIPTGGAGYPITFTWLGPLALNFSSCRLIDLFGGVLVNVDMLANDSATVTNSAISQLLIIATRNGNALGWTVIKEDKPGIPDAFALKQNYPNPFNPSTTIAFNIEKTSFTEVIIYDMAGRKVATLASQQLNPGFYSVEWNGRSDEGAPAASGVYYARMTATGEGVDFSSVRKLLLMK